MATMRRLVPVCLGLLLLYNGAARASEGKRPLSSSLLEQRLSDGDSFGRYTDRSKERPDAVAVPASSEGPIQEYRDAPLQPAAPLVPMPQSAPPAPVLRVAAPAAPQKAGLDFFTVYKYVAGATLGGALLFTFVWWRQPTVRTIPYTVELDSVSVNGESIPLARQYAPPSRRRFSKKLG